jgi:hypothetical protein
MSKGSVRQVAHIVFSDSQGSRQKSLRDSRSESPPGFPHGGTLGAGYADCAVGDDCAACAGRDGSSGCADGADFSMSR